MLLKHDQKVTKEFIKNLYVYDLSRNTYMYMLCSFCVNLFCFSLFVNCLSNV